MAQWVNQLPFDFFFAVLELFFSFKTGCVCSCAAFCPHFFVVYIFFVTARVRVVAYRPIEFTHTHTHSWFYMFHLSDIHTMNVNEPLMFLSSLPANLPPSPIQSAAAKKWMEKRRDILYLPCLHTLIFCVLGCWFFFSLHLHHLHSSTFFSPTEKQFLGNPTVKLLWILFA